MPNSLINKQNAISAASIEDVDGIWEQPAGAAGLDANFATIHDVPYFSIIWDGSNFIGSYTLTDDVDTMTPDNVLAARQMVIETAAAYGLRVASVEMVDQNFYTIRFREAGAE